MIDTNKASDMVSPLEKLREPATAGAAGESGKEGQASNMEDFDFE